MTLIYIITSNKKEKNPDTSASASREDEPSDSGESRHRLPTSADPRRLVPAADDPVISGVNEAGMLFQAQDIAVRAAGVRLCERALRIVVGGCWLPITVEYQCTLLSQLHYPSSPIGTNPVYNA